MIKITLTNTGKEIYEAYGLVDVRYVLAYNCGHEKELDMDDTECLSWNYPDKAVEYYESYQDGKLLINVIVYHVNEDCEGCWLLYVDTLPAPQGFDDVVLYHGLDAYKTVIGQPKLSLEDVSNRVYNIIDNSKWQICCSTKPIGYIGIVVKGNVLCASNKDLCSGIDKKSGYRRYVDKRSERFSHVISHANQLDSSIWDHDEIITDNSKPAAIWVKSDVDNRVIAFAMSLAKELNIPFIQL